jgi:hypothetical protein
MAKKKVVKHSSKASHTKKHITHNNHKDVAQEAVPEETAPEQVIEQPVAPKTEQPVMQPVTAVLSTDKDSIYAEEKPKETVVKPENVAQGDRLKSLAIVVSVIIIVLWLVLMVASLQHNTRVEVVEHNVTSYKYVNAKLDLADYTNITNFKYTEKVTLVGYLRLESVKTDATTKVDTRYIVDDYGNKIALVLGYNSKYEPLFINNYTTDKTFQVQGTFKYTYSGQRNLFLIDVSSIAPVTHPVVNTAVNTITYENVTEGNGYTINLTRGWNKLTGK